VIPPRPGIHTFWVPAGQGWADRPIAPASSRTDTREVTIVLTIWAVLLVSGLVLGLWLALFLPDKGR
jgi:hypothetical protein